MPFILKLQSPRIGALEPVVILRIEHKLKETSSNKELLEQWSFYRWRGTFGRRRIGVTEHPR